MKKLNLIMLVIFGWGAYGHSTVLENGETIFNCTALNPEVQLSLEVKGKPVVDGKAESTVTIVDKNGIFLPQTTTFSAGLSIETSYFYENYNYELVNEAETIGQLTVSMKSREFCGRTSCVISQEPKNNHKAVLKMYEKEILFTCY